MTLRIEGSLITDDVANEGGGAVFFVSNDRSGTMSITGSKLRSNPILGFETAGLPGVLVLAASPPEIVDSTIE